MHPARLTNLPLLGMLEHPGPRRGGQQTAPPLPVCLPLLKHITLDFWLLLFVMDAAARRMGLHTPRCSEDDNKARCQHNTDVLQTSPGCLWLPCAVLMELSAVTCREVGSVGPPQLKKYTESNDCL